MSRKNTHVKLDNWIGRSNQAFSFGVEGVEQAGRPSKTIRFFHSRDLEEIPLLELGLRHLSASQRISEDEQRLCWRKRYGATILAVYEFVQPRGRYLKNTARVCGHADTRTNRAGRGPHHLCSTANLDLITNDDDITAHIPRFIATSRQACFE